MYSGSQDIEFIARFSTKNPAVMLVRLVAYFLGVGAYLVLLTALTNGILGPRLDGQQALADTLSIAVTAPALLAALIFYSTKPLLRSRGLAWRAKQFFAGYALMVVLVLLLASALWLRTGTMLAVGIMMVVLALVLPSLQHFFARIARVGEPLVAAVVLLFVPTAHSASTMLTRAAHGPYALVEVKVERPTRSAHPGFPSRHRPRPPQPDC